jgi:hypothetical protein
MESSTMQSSWLYKVLPSIVAFFLGCVMTVVTGGVNLANRVSVLETKHDDLAGSVHAISDDVRSLDKKVERLLAQEKNSKGKE